MDTKWKNIRAYIIEYIKEYVKNLSARKKLILCCVIFLCSLIMCLFQYHCWEYYPVFIAFTFLLGIVTIIQAVKYNVSKVITGVQNESGDVFINITSKLKRQYIRGNILYIILLSIILFGGLTDASTMIHNAQVTSISEYFYYLRYMSYFCDLRNYGMEWILILLYLVPFLSSYITLTTEIHKEWERRSSTKEEIAIATIEKSENLKVELLTNVTHDLKTPLTAIIGYLALMEKEELSPVMQDYVKAATAKSELLKDMIDKVFEISKASSGNLNLNLMTIKLNKLVQQVTLDVEDTYSDKNPNFVTTLTDEDTSIHVDNVYAYRIVQNLLVNAVKYSLSGTRIYVKTYIEKNPDTFYDMVCLDIINVSEFPLDNDIEKYKERFVRGDKSRSTEGNGLGLAIVDTYTAALGGSFDIEIIGDSFKATVRFKAKEFNDEKP